MKKSFLTLAMVALLASCGEKKAETSASEASASDSKSTAEVVDEKAAPAQATDAKSVTGFDSSEFMFDGIITDIKEGEVQSNNQGAIFYLTLTPVSHDDATYNAFSKAVFDKIKEHSGRVGDDMLEELTEPFTAEPGKINGGTYTYKDNGCDVYCSVLGFSEDDENAFKLSFTKYY